MLSIRPIAAGEEILNYYGPLSNAELLRRYGYTSAKHTRYDEMELQGKDMVEVFQKTYSLDQKFLEKASLLGFDLNKKFVFHRNAGYPNDVGILTFEPEPADVPKDVEEAITLLSCLARAVDFHKWKKGELDIIEQREIRLDMCQVLLQALDLKLGDYDTSTAEDEQILSTQQPPRSRLHLAVKVRLGEKMLIQELRTKVLEMINNLRLVDESIQEAPTRFTPPKKRRKLNGQSDSLVK